MAILRPYSLFAYSDHSNSLIASRVWKYSRTTGSVYCSPHVGTYSVSVISSTVSSSPAIHSIRALIATRQRVKSSCVIAIGLFHHPFEFANCLWTLERLEPNSHHVKAIDAFRYLAKGLLQLAKVTFNLCADERIPHFAQVILEERYQVCVFSFVQFRILLFGVPFGVSLTGLCPV